MKFSLFHSASSVAQVLSVSAALLVLLLSPSAVLSANVETQGVLRGQSGAPAETADGELPTKRDVDHDRRHLTSVNFQCLTPEDNFYEVTFSVKTTYAPSRACTPLEMSDLRDLLDWHFDQFVGHHNILGPVDLTNNGDSCPAPSSRRALAKAVSSSNNQTEANTDYSIATTADTVAAAQRKLFVGGPIGFRFLGSGVCRFCRITSNDARRKLTGGDGPIFISIDTDNSPQEMSFEIKTTTGDVVYSRSNFATANTEYTEVVWLNAGQEYVFVVKDTYGDGWCCNNGAGGIWVWAGIDRLTNIQLFSVNHDFGLSHSSNFRVPHIAPISFDSPSFVADALYPQLEYDISTYLTFYLQQAYQHYVGHCMFGSIPSVWVDLNTTSEAAALAPSVCA